MLLTECLVGCDGQSLCCFGVLQTALRAYSSALVRVCPRLHVQDGPPQAVAGGLAYLSVSRAEDSDEKVEHDNRKNDQVRLVVKISRYEHWHGKGRKSCRGNLLWVVSHNIGSFENHSSTVARAIRDWTILQRSNCGSGAFATKRYHGPGNPSGGLSPLPDDKNLKSTEV